MQIERREIEKKIVNNSLALSLPSLCHFIILSVKIWISSLNNFLVKIFPIDLIYRMPLPGCRLRILISPPFPSHAENVAYLFRNFLKDSRPMLKDPETRACSNLQCSQKKKQKRRKSSIAVSADVAWVIWSIIGVYISSSPSDWDHCSWMKPDRRGLEHSSKARKNQFGWRQKKSIWIRSQRRNTRNSIRSPTKQRRSWALLTFFVSQNSVSTLFSPPRLVRLKRKFILSH